MESRYAMILAVLLMAQLSFPSYSEADFSNKSTMDYSAIPGGAEAVLKDGKCPFLTVPGKFGNYTLTSGCFNGGFFVSVQGEGEEGSQKQLFEELALLESSGILITKCDLSKLGAAFETGQRFCGNSGEWTYCVPGGCAPQPRIGPGLPVETGSQIQPEVQTTTATHPLPMPSDLGKSAADGDLPFGQQSIQNANPEQLLAQEGAEEQPQIKMEQILQLAGVFLAAVIASYLLLQQRPAPQADLEVERLLSNNTRAGIMEELFVADKIPTDLSLRLGKSKATVVEHLDALVVAGLVEKIVTQGRKFVYYRLTQKGRQALLRKRSAS